MLPYRRIGNHASWHILGQITVLPRETAVVEHPAVYDRDMVQPICRRQLLLRLFPLGDIHQNNVTAIKVQHGASFE